MLFDHAGVLYWLRLEIENLLAVGMMVLVLIILHILEDAFPDLAARLNI